MMTRTRVSLSQTRKPAFCLDLNATQAPHHLPIKYRGECRFRGPSSEMSSERAAEFCCLVRLEQHACAESDDHCLEIRSSFGNAPLECPAHACLMIIVELLLDQAQATCIRMAVPEGDQVRSSHPLEKHTDLCCRSSVISLCTQAPSPASEWTTLCADFPRPENLAVQHAGRHDFRAGN